MPPSKQASKQASLSLADERLIVGELLKQYPYALFLFSDPRNSLWHLVNVRNDPQQARRRVYRRIVVGPDERLRTASERVAMLDAARGAVLSPFALQAQHDEAFDVRAVTRSFFRDYQAAFRALQAELCAQSADAPWAHDYALQFLNRLMFLYFLQRKRWLGDDAEFLRHFWEAYRGAPRPEDSFVSQWLHVLFFEAFNNSFQAARADRQYLPKAFRDQLALAPYLNGGLFSQSDLDRKHEARLPDERFAAIFRFLEDYNFTISEDTPLDQEVAVDPEMIGKVYESLVNVSEKAEEGDAKRHDEGIYYTPRVEIDLMCRLALVDWLTNQLGQEHKRALQELIFAFDPPARAAADAALAAQDLWPRLAELLRGVTVLDPACGSGSFLVGMLQVLDDLLARAGEQLGSDQTPYERRKEIIGRSLYGVDVMGWAARVAELRLWLQLVIETEIDPPERHLRPLLPNLSFKVRQGDSLVQEVGGIDLALRQGSGAISRALQGRITRLKGDKLALFANKPTEKPLHEEGLRREELDIFRAIVGERLKDVEERLKKKEQALRTVQASLLDEAAPEPASGRPELERERQALAEEKAQLESARQALRAEQHPPFVWDMAFVEVLEGEKQGFDIVIGNPPYVRQEQIRDPLAPATADKATYKGKLERSVYAAWPKAFGWERASGKARDKLDRKSDLYIYFYLHGLSLLHPQGSFCFITSNAWLDVGYGRDLQRFLLTRGQVKLILDNQRRSFAEADVNTIIALLGAPSDGAGARPGSGAQVARFVMFSLPYEATLDAVIWEEVDEAPARRTTPDYRVMPLTQAAMLEGGLDKETRVYRGDKWGGKYLRAPDIYWTIMAKAKDIAAPLYTFFAGERYLNTGGADGFFILSDVTPSAKGLWHVHNPEILRPGSVPFEGDLEGRYLVPLIKNYSKTNKCIQLRGYDAYCLVVADEQPSHRLASYIRWGEEQGYASRSVTKSQSPWYKPTRQMLRPAPILVPRSFNDSFVIHHNPCGFLSLRFYRLHPKREAKSKEVESRLVGMLNSTLMILFLETLGNKNLGEGVLDFFMEDFLRLRFPVVEDPAIGNVYDVMKERQIGSVWDEFGVHRSRASWSQASPLCDRRDLDTIVFDAIKLSQGERDAVYEGIVTQVEARINKAASLRKRRKNE